MSIKDQYDCTDLFQIIVTERDSICSDSFIVFDTLFVCADRQKKNRTMGMMKHACAVLASFILLTELTHVVDCHRKHHKRKTSSSTSTMTQQTGAANADAASTTTATSPAPAAAAPSPYNAVYSQQASDPYAGTAGKASFLNMYKLII